MNKECPLCGEENAISAIECEDCGNLFSDAQPSENKNPASPQYAWKIRCPDGHEYDVDDENSRIQVCALCEDEVDKHEIAKCRPFRVVVNPTGAGDVDDAERVPTPTVSVLVLSEIKTGKQIRIEKNGVIGRLGDIEQDYFSQNMRVSEHHCRVLFESGEFKIERLPTGRNTTKINDIELSKGIRNIIRNGDYFTLADLMFEIAICSEEIQGDSSQEPLPPDEQDAVIAKFVITCPKCGRTHNVDSIDARINECSDCDEYDKHEISKVGAAVKYAN
jgi:hypothetical protein